MGKSAPLDYVTAWPSAVVQQHPEAHIRALGEAGVNLQARHVRHATLAKFHSDPAKRSEHAQLAKTIAAHLEARNIPRIV